MLPALSGLVDKSIVAAVENPPIRTVPGRGTGCWRPCARTAWSGWPKRARSQRSGTAFAAYYLNLAETADPVLRGAGQGRWLRELAAEQDNLHAALRWTIACQDGDTSLRFVRALGWYWMLRGQPGEPEALAREALALEPANIGADGRGPGGGRDDGRRAQLGD